MAKISNDDCIRDAAVIRDSLIEVSDLNRSSTAILKQLVTALEDCDGRFAFNLALRAEYMHIFCTQVAGK